ncbi:tyrosine--tRNA ligase [Candidatus Uhrbacteria bacterium RIFCSPHIGHO2_02_FULL_47_29]|uniref:Tyrosine--tRNA ligase n=1 Tax=Candidatus Uhrbacteria bacterium RIFCSPLOWO2_01_FULL_47_25 TaxID=1802402 RepID=A0A1F7UUB4_9BACT|nr:MAG: tyrosine--tRNA ligase [Candidatus Uhrbacteria bacterium RIFCSPHIGHO2_01_FULL_46_23]OGL68245.1 MAG: tyrosine--tRNA ligase [Candidatus Uhrbacteria bacterium RIFCSPHIGHO2_02_FULL_47_29]OGL81257.1 MAG: tyrosine--tRNA ligase [Candidatus Uhrbacteria bacterium RIFCSPLOWO2_01_FULL_47_25]OGL86034.1 MAG: tyrosine--tRNA ligase [Candidatus Uhrbacteria bacterium RIFCSPLOWO2_02_FULL_46_19]
MIDKEKINEILTRGVANIYPSREALEKILLSGKKLRIYNGIDPTGKLHIGHAVVLKKLRQFQDLGHEVIVLIGDFTARIGDPTDKLATRKKLTKEDVKRNSRNYKKIIGKILDLTKSNIRFLHNEKWTNKLKPENMLELASYFTVARLLERDMFQERIKEGKEIYVHEFLYPIFQAYDSITMDVDMEIGGNDQTFNMLAGRTLLRKLKNKEKFVLTTKLLTDPSGKKIGKTEGNMINLDETAENMYGKIMSIPDSLIVDYFTLCTDVADEEIQKIKHALETHAVNPRDAKMRLAKKIVSLYHNQKEALKAEEAFVKIFQKHEMPEIIPEIRLEPWPKTLAQALVATKLAASMNDARQAIQQGGVKIQGQVVKNPNSPLPKVSGIVVSRGKRRFCRLR